MMECIDPNYIRQDKNGLIVMVSRAEFLEWSGKTGDSFKYYEARCGKCLACKLVKSYQKASRLMIESVNRKFSYFITLTFNNENYNEFMFFGQPLREGQLFIKRLRKRYAGIGIKYFLTGELGTENKRYHYHAIIFSDHGLFEDMYKIGETNEGRPLFTSPILKSIWGKGRVSVDYACMDSLKYVANYVQDSEGSVAHSFSKGIGDDYIEKYLDHDKTRALICGNRYQLTRTQLTKLNIKKEEYTPNISLNVPMEIRKRNMELIKRRFYRK